MNAFSRLIQLNYFNSMLAAKCDLIAHYSMLAESSRFDSVRTRYLKIVSVLEKEIDFIVERKKAL